MWRGACEPHTPPPPACELEERLPPPQGLHRLDVLALARAWGYRSHLWAEAAAAAALEAPPSKRPCLDPALSSGSPTPSADYHSRHVLSALYVNPRFALAFVTARLLLARRAV